jgi:hypothetical protein
MCAILAPIGALTLVASTLVLIGVWIALKDEPRHAPAGEADLVAQNEANAHSGQGPQP